MPYSAIGPIAVHLPEKVENIDQLSTMFAKWDIETIYAKTGVRNRHIAGARPMRVGPGSSGGGKAFHPV